MDDTGLRITIDDSQGRAMAEAWRVAPMQLLQNLAEAFQQIGRYDIERLTAEQLSGGRFLNTQSAGVRKSFKFKASDPARVTDPRQLFVNEYTKWPGAVSHETGGEIKGSRGAMWVMLASGRGPSGKRRFSDEQIEQNLRSGRFALIRLPDQGWVLSDTGHENIGDVRVRVHNRKYGNLIAILRRSVRMKKRLDWEGLIQRNAEIHTQLIGEAIDKTISELYGRGS